MNIMKQINKIFMNKNIAVILYALIAAGIVFMLFPHSSGDTAALKENNENREEAVDNSPEAVERRLEQVLGMAEGTGKVRVMITYKNNGNIVVAENKTDEESSEENSKRISSRSDVVFNNENMPVILSENTPEIEGVVIVAEGGGNIQVKDGLIRAAQALLGVEPHKIEVLKMKTEG